MLEVKAGFLFSPVLCEVGVILEVGGAVRLEPAAEARAAKAGGGGNELLEGRNCYCSPAPSLFHLPYLCRLAALLRCRAPSAHTPCMKLLATSEVTLQPWTSEVARCRPGRSSRGRSRPEAGSLAALERDRNRHAASTCAHTPMLLLHSHWYCCLPKLCPSPALAQTVSKLSPCPSFVSIPASSLLLCRSVLFEIFYFLCSS